jgi:hypothetical protein
MDGKADSLRLRSGQALRAARPFGMTRAGRLGGELGALGYGAGGVRPTSRKGREKWGTRGTNPHLYKKRKGRPSAVTDRKRPQEG